MTTACEQDKLAEAAFFSEHSQLDEYNVFTVSSTRELFERCRRLAGFKVSSSVADIGCGSGVFTRYLRENGINPVGLDLSHPLLMVGRRRYADIDLVAGDAEFLPFPTGKLDGVLLSALIHHLPDPARCAGEVFRVLKPGGAFVAFDPNRYNPFMYLYRDRSSPFYSSKGVTANERPVIPQRVADTFADAGFRVAPPEYISMEYRYIADRGLSRLLSAYNTLESFLFRPRALRRYRAFVISYGFKP